MLFRIAGMAVAYLAPIFLIYFTTFNKFSVYQNEQQLTLGGLIAAIILVIFIFSDVGKEIKESKHRWLKIAYTGLIRAAFVASIGLMVAGVKNSITPIENIVYFLAATQFIGMGLNAYGMWIIERKAK